MKYILIICGLQLSIILKAQSLYEMPVNPQSRLSSFENPNGIKGNGGKTYTRTGLWMQLCEKLNIPCFPVPVQLGEDRLATFGAYREYE